MNLPGLADMFGGTMPGFGGGGPSGASGSSVFDSSGWNVNFGSGEITSSRRDDAAPLAGTLDPYLPYLLIAAGVLVAWRMTRR